MNELINADSGVLIDADPVPSGGYDFWMYFTADDVFILIWKFTRRNQIFAPRFKDKHGLKNATTFEYDVKPEYICAAMDTVLKMPPEERKKRAANAKARYLQQIQFFDQKMKDLTADIIGITRFKGHHEPLQDDDDWKWLNIMILCKVMCYRHYSG